MINPAGYIRSELFALLDGQIDYEGIVPVTEDHAFTPTGKYMVILGEQNISENDNKQAYVHVFDQVIEIVGEAVSMPKKPLDEIAQQVFDLLMPSKNIHAMTDSGTLQITNVKRGSQTYLEEQTAEGTQLRRLIIRFSFTVTEK